ncbi:heme-containing dehydratase-domain containing protein [Rhexocercosporidium sp. MPI-PUGE-AT-0058]|nr:heme-containing dehydratase-domain containing protein [Rhexocercosporidium sp. MPI-PUGE-AT-0058]
MYLAELPHSHPFVLLILGNSAVHIETLEHFGPTAQHGRSRIWLTYWTSPASHDAWWKSSSVQTFWDALPDNAGVWREKLTLHSSRVQLGTNKTFPSGFAHLDVSIEECTSTERLESSLKTFPERGEVSSDIRERKYWLEKFDGPARKWIGDVVGSGEEGGVLSSRLCSKLESGVLNEEVAEGEKEFDTLDYNRKVQVLYFLDLGYMERIGKRNQGHVKLRESFMKSYCPAGQMANGDQLMWVEQGGQGSWLGYLRKLMGWGKDSA